MREKFRRGEWPVKAPIGYRHVRDEKGKSTIVEDKDTSYLIKQMFKLYATGQYSMGSLSREVADRGLKTKNGKLFSYQRVKDLLQNKFYMGSIVMWNEEVKGKHKPIIDESLFN